MSIPFNGCPQPPQAGCEAGAATADAAKGFEEGLEAGGREGGEEAGRSGRGEGERASISCTGACAFKGDGSPKGLELGDEG